MGKSHTEGHLPDEGQFRPSVRSSLINYLTDKIAAHQIRWILERFGFHMIFGAGKPYKMTNSYLLLAVQVREKDKKRINLVILKIYEWEHVEERRQIRK